MRILKDDQMHCICCDKSKNKSLFTKPNFPSSHSRLCLECKDKGFEVGRNMFSVDLNVLQKKCKCCDKYKSASDYHVYRHGVDGISGRCRECANKAKRNAFRSIDRCSILNEVDSWWCGTMKYLLIPWRNVNDS